MTGLSGCTALGGRGIFVRF